MCVVYLDSSLCIVFFFKQKTAYEMRISDWSSDVCSSDLILFHRTYGLTHVLAHVPDCHFGLFSAGPDHFHNVAAALFSHRGNVQADHISEIGRASCRERVCTYV